MSFYPWRTDQTRPGQEQNHFIDTPAERKGSRSCKLSAKRGREEEPLRRSRKRKGAAPQDLAPHPMETRAKKKKREKREEECTVSFKSRYTVGDLLGTGGYGSVYAGVRKADGKQIAIKFVPKHHTERSITVPGETRSLPLEVALMEMVCKPPRCQHIVELLEWFDCDCCFILILERPVPCMDLFDFLDLHERQLPEPLARLIMRQVVQAVLHCRDRGVLHRDVKEENLLVNTDTLDVKLIDFGCGDLLKTGPYTRFGGTKVYRPPEWLIDRKYEGSHATIWSLGVLLYSIICGDEPFEKEEDIVEAHLCFKGNPSRECRHLITWCLQKDPEKRPVLEDVLAHQWFLEGLQN
ncbi:serine/threonine-protein kinase pim-2-like isoform X2 [Brachyhypopomus gauderio]|uniref:serine/threonine-protein kinase pim-2-like isoform X2 n=1 Tax=Brachyhypopomus gauderio TaxID=698409 RepID=UPI004042543B